jgi:hypothetical protein
MSKHLENYIQLKKERDDFLCQPKSLLADLVLLAFMDDVLESVQAAMGVLQLKSIPHRASPCIRTSFEASQQALVLVTQDDYSFVGTKAWVYYCKRDKKWLSMAKPNGSDINSDADVDTWFEQKLKDMTELWDKLSPGQGKLIEKAQQELVKQSSRPDNWLGKDMALAQDEAYRKIASSHDFQVDQKMSMTNRTLYSALSRDTHTGLRVDTVITFESYANGIKVSIAERDKELLLKSASTSAMLSVSEMLMALDYRKHSLF